MPINAPQSSIGAEHANRTSEGGKRAIKLSSTGADLPASTAIIVRQTRVVSNQVLTGVHDSGDSGFEMLTQLTTAGRDTDALRPLCIDISSISTSENPTELETMVSSVIADLRRDANVSMRRLPTMEHVCVRITAALGGIKPTVARIRTEIIHIFRESRRRRGIRPNISVDG